MNLVDLCNKVKRLRVFETSLGILALTLCIIYYFFWLDYRVVTKRARLPLVNQRVFWLSFDAKGDKLGAEKTEFLSDFHCGCDVFDGDWVWDRSYPLYQSKDCRFLDQGFRCSENGRPDFFYTKWRWQPRHCNLPRFNGRIMLEKLRNKRVVFAGDSIGRNQWESLLCLLSLAIPNTSSIYEVNGNPITKHKGFLVFKFDDYNCTVEYFRAPFLVLQSRPPPVDAPKNMKTTLKLDQMDRTSPQWRNADLLVLNTGHWWNYEKTIRGGCYFQEGSNLKTNMSIDNAYKRALETVFQWIHSEVNTTKTQVFFRTYAPVHFRGGTWRTGGTCHKETLPQLGSSLVPKQTWTRYNIFINALSDYASSSEKSKEIQILNISNMSSRRKDGHSSLYYLGHEAGPVPLHRQDCSHWCLPGVPDSWNDILYAMFLKREMIRNSNVSSFSAQV